MSINIDSPLAVLTMLSFTVILLPKKPAWLVWGVVLLDAVYALLLVIKMVSASASA